MFNVVNGHKLVKIIDRSGHTAEDCFETTPEGGTSKLPNRRPKVVWSNVTAVNQILNFCLMGHFSAIFWMLFTPISFQSTTTTLSPGSFERIKQLMMFFTMQIWSEKTTLWKIWNWKVALHYATGKTLKADSHKMQRSAFSAVGCINAEIGNILIPSRNATICHRRTRKMQ